MILPGHVAAAYLAAKLSGVSMQGAMAASMAPDLVDKPTRWLAGLTPNDRIPAHTALFWGATTLFAALFVDGGFARGWATGYAVHLACDQVNASLNPGRIYFFWPFKRYRFHRGPTGLESSLQDFSLPSLLIEAGLAIVGLAVWLHSRRARADGSTSSSLT